MAPRPCGTVLAEVDAAKTGRFMLAISRLLRATDPPTRATSLLEPLETSESTMPS